MSNKEKYKEFKETIKEAKKKSKELFSDAFAELSKDLFDENPRLIKFSWTQYTPYFNDGDPCYFSVHNDSDCIELTVLDTDGDPEIFERYEHPYEPETDEEKFRNNLLEKITNFLSNFDEEDLESAFGEGEVIVKRKGNVETEEYSHD